MRALTTGFRALISRNRNVHIAAGVGGFVALLVFLISPTAQAAPGDLDLTFGSGGTLVAPYGGWDDLGRPSTAFQPDGKIIMAGDHSEVLTSRYNTDGTLDATFGDDGRALIDFGEESWPSPKSVVVQDDGKIIVVGSACASTIMGTVCDFGLARYQTDGSPDAEFGDNGRVSVDFGAGLSKDNAYAVALQDDGRILLAGTSESDFAAARFHDDGSLDTSFSGDGLVKTDIAGEYDVAQSIAVQDDGKIVLAGAGGVTSFFVTRVALVRYNANGTLDTSFSGDGKIFTEIGPDNSQASDLLIQPDGRLLVAGHSGDSILTPTPLSDFAIARFTPAGNLDSTFSQDGMQIIDFGGDGDSAERVVLGEGGKAIVVGRAQNWDNEEQVSMSSFAVVRLLANGARDPGFSSDGTATVDFGQHDVADNAVVLDDGKILVVGSTCLGGSCDVGFARFQGGDGSPDTTPPDTTIASGPQGAISTQAPTFTFISSEPDSTFECRVDSQPFAACTSPHTVSPLSPGGHVFEVRAIDSSGNVDPTPATRSFSIELASQPPPPGAADSKKQAPKQKPQALRIMSLRLAASKITTKQRPVLSFRLSKAARVSVKILKVKAGVRKGKRCVKPGKSVGGKRCDLRVRTMTRSLKAGVQTVRLPRLAKGRYHVSIWSIDATYRWGPMVLQVTR